MWVKEHTLSPRWIGHSENSGFRVLRAVPRGSPSYTDPIPVKAEHLEDVHKFYGFLHQSEVDEWKDIIRDWSSVLTPPTPINTSAPWFPPRLEEVRIYLL